MLMIFLFVLLCFVPIMLILAMLGWAMIFALLVGGALLAVAALLLLPMMSQTVVSQARGRVLMLVIGILILVGEIVFIWNWATRPVDPELPDRSLVASIYVQDIDYYDTAWEKISREVTMSDPLQTVLLDNLYDTSYKHDFRIKWPWQESLKREYDNIYKVELQDADGNVLKTVHIYDKLTVRPLNKRGKEIKYRATEEQPLDNSPILDAFDLQRREEVQARWQDYIDALIGSLTYTDDPGELSFTIPESRPKGTFHLLLKAKGMAIYDPEGEYVPTELNTCAEEQKSQSWKAGTVYTLSLNDSIFEYNYMELHLEGITFTFDLLPYMDARYTYKK